MDEEFDSYVAEAMAALPAEFREKLDNVAIFVEDHPSAEQIKKYRLRENNVTLLGLYEGIPQTRRGNYGVGATVPDKITLFRFPILTGARSREHLVELIRETLWHEIAHHFGMSEEEIAKAQNTHKRKNTIG